MSNQYIEAICTMPKEIAFGYDPYSNLSFTQKAQVKAGLVRPQSTVEYRWHYAKESAYKLNEVKISFDKPMTGLVSKAFNKVNGAWTQFSLPPTSNKSAWYQGAIALQAMAIYTGGKKGLRRKARDLYISGDNTTLKTDIGSIQSAAKDVYRKCAKAMEVAGLSSSQSQVKFVLNHLRNYAKISEIVFGKNLSIESSTTMQTSTSRSSKVEEEENKVRKARGLETKAATAIPFKNKIEGNLFRAWVNDNHKGWAKANDLSRSGKHDNSYVKKAWKRWGQDYQMAMAQKLFMERKNDDLIIGKPIPVAAPIPVEPTPMAISAPLPFDDASDPFADEDPEIGMLALLQDDPEEFLKEYWYIPAGGFVGIVGLALGIRALIK